MPNIALNYAYGMEINTTPGNPEGTYAPIKKGFSNISEAMNEVVYQASFLGDEGYGSTYVTGGQLIFTLSGVRMVGDPAQDYIFGDETYYCFGASRETDIRITCPDGSVIACPVTLAKIARSGGDANTGTSVSVEVHCNGKPAVINTRLSALVIGGLMLSPAFDPQKGTYYCTTANESDTVTATAADSAATVAITNGSETVANGSAATWASGKNTLTITVTSGEFTRDYVVHVTYNAV